MARQFGGQHGYGFRMPPAGSVTPFHIASARLGLALDYPLAFTNAFLCPPVMDQGGTGSCTGHGTSVEIAITTAGDGSPLPFVCSPRGLYDGGRAIVRQKLADGTLPPLQDDGADPSAVRRAAAEWGVRPIQAPMADGRYSDCDPSNVNDEPTLDELELDAEVKLPGDYHATGTGQALVDEVCVAVSNKLGVGVGFLVDTIGPRSFEGWDPTTGPIGPPNMQEPGIGQNGHWVALIGYRTDTATGKKVFQIQNSWGTVWGQSGRGECTEEWLLAAFFVGVLARPS